MIVKKSQPAVAQPTINLVGTKIDKIFISAEAGKCPELIRYFFERVQTNYDEAIRMASRLFLSILAVWFLTYALHAKWIEKIEFLADLKVEMIVASPFLIGMLSYGLLSALAGAVVLWEAVSRGVGHMLPTAWEQGLDDLLAPPTFSNVERMLEPSPKHKLQTLFSGAWFMFITMIMFGGSLAAFTHTTSLLVQSPLRFFQSPLKLLSVSLGAAAWVRGVVLFASAIEATGGFSLGHHRGSAKDRAIKSITWPS